MLHNVNGVLFRECRNVDSRAFIDGEESYTWIWIFEPDNLRKSIECWQRREPGIDILELIANTEPTQHTLMPPVRSYDKYDRKL